MEGYTTCTMNVPTSKVRLFRAFAREIGCTASRRQTKEKPFLQTLKAECEEALAEMESVKRGKRKAHTMDELYAAIEG